MKPYIKRETKIEKEQWQDRNKYNNIEDNVRTRTVDKDTYLTVEEFIDPYDPKPVSSPFLTVFNFVQIGM